MFPFDFFSKPLHAELAMLIVASPLQEEEKRGWLELLPVMNENEKNTLLRNLREEVKDFVELEKMSLQLLDQKIQALYGQASS